ncbi:MAG: DUF2769 domain-containing protein [Methanoregula sp.]|nr:DUF2769 domain-containing protein [Methanoregula sp.]
MDAFEQWMDNSWQKNAHDRKESMLIKKAACICPACPSHTNKSSDDKELIYCITGKSPLCTAEVRDCSCTKCSVTAELGLIYHDFCFTGNEAAQRYANEVH